MMSAQATQAYYNPVMQEYFHKKFGWDTATFHNIDWDSSEKEYHPLSLGRRLASFKLQNGLWLTNKILHKCKKIPSPLCSQCTQHPETHNHVLCCKHAQQIRLPLWNKVTTVLTATLKTPTLLQDALEFGICSLQEGDTDTHWPFPFPSKSDPTDDAIFIAFHYQTSIGWSQALHSHLSSQWGQAMALFMHHWHPHQTFQPANWTRTVIHSLREYSYSQWTVRNSHIYGTDQAASQALHRQALQQKITEAYNNISSIPSNEQSFTFDTPLTTRILQPTTLLRAWLLQY